VFGARSSPLDGLREKTSALADRESHVCKAVIVRETITAACLSSVAGDARAP
jgi:hypothetical protein